MIEPEPRLNARATAALAIVNASIAASWADHARTSPETDDRAIARAIFAEPSGWEWRLVDAALDHIRCDECGARLGSGPRGCPECDFADGHRFAGRETNPPGALPGNEHAIRVSSAVLRAPRRYPVSAVRGNELFLPLFLAGDMPTREEQERFEAAVKRGLPPGVDLSVAQTFAQLVALATGRR